MIFCQYKDIFGKPNEGVHSYKLLDIAIIDMGLTLLGSYLIHKYYLNKYLSLSELTLIILIIGIFMHKMFCVRTTLNKIIFE